MIETIVQATLEAEMTAALGAEKGERTPARLSYRSGYYGRSLITRVGTLELRVHDSAPEGVRDATSGVGARRLKAASCGANGATLFLVRTRNPAVPPRIDCAGRWRYGYLLHNTYL